MAPIEPVVLGDIEGFEAGAFGGAGGGAALEVPVAAGGVVDQDGFGGAVEGAVLRLEGAEGLAVGAEGDQEGAAAEGIEDELFLDDGLVGVGAGGAVDTEAKDEGAGAEAGLGVAEDGGGGLHAFFPVLFRVFRGEGADFGEDGAGGLFGAPEGEGEFVGMDELEGAALEGAGDGEAADLLPVGSGFFVAHEEVLIVDASEAEGERDAVDLARPHQTGVTERSIGADEGDAAEGVVDDVVVGEGADGVGTGGAVDGDGEEFVVGFEGGLGGGLEGGSVDGVEHEFEDVDAGEAEGDGDGEGDGGEGELAGAGSGPGGFGGEQGC